MDEHIEKDKINAPYLLALSYSGFITFRGSYSQGGIIYWKFYPKDKVLTLIDKLHTKTDPKIPARDLFEAIETFWQQVARTRNEGTKHGEKHTY
jgi:hypothetical protein